MYHRADTCMDVLCICAFSSDTRINIKNKLNSQNTRLI